MAITTTELTAYAASMSMPAISFPGSQQKELAMKMKSLCLAMALVGLTSHYAAAADGTLYFSGTIVNSSCKLASGNEKGLIEVKMGAVPLSKLKMIPMAPGQKLGSILASKIVKRARTILCSTVLQPTRRLSLTYWLSMRVILQLKSRH